MIAHCFVICTHPASWRPEDAPSAFLVDYSFLRKPSLEIVLFCDYLHIIPVSKNLPSSDVLASAIYIVMIFCDCID